jgi:sugar phosphate isomerase/epimerase
MERIRSMKIAISGYEFKKDLKGLLETARKLNVSYVELWLDKNWNFQKNETDRVKDLLDEYNLRPAGISMLSRMNPANNATEAEEVAKGIIDAVEVAEKLNAKFINSYFGANKNKSEEKRIPFYKEYIKPCLEGGKSRDKDRSGK